jgi:thiamine transporter ThiT
MRIVNSEIFQRIIFRNLMLEPTSKIALKVSILRKCIRGSILRTLFHYLGTILFYSNRIYKARESNYVISIRKSFKI